MVQNINSTKKAQAYSADILVVMVILLLGVLFIVVSKVNTTSSEVQITKVYDEATRDSQTIYNSLKEDKIISEDNEVDLERVLSLDRDKLREELGIKNDFAIVFEKNGNLIRIDPENNVNCVGSDKIIINGEPCVG
ncbi:MAG: hypothetical protein H6500_01390 [Candidatus Woesearchaeota archaeon]|nr:hypothetical protein [Nanoarchaeota archaeon]USN44483.1 MAG: hypothetical protein H6500_01390 [Candidatus Woesearchaeota archaeon]